MEKGRLKAEYPALWHTLVTGKPKGCEGCEMAEEMTPRGGIVLPEPTCRCGLTGDENVSVHRPTCSDEAWQDRVMAEFADTLAVATEDGVRTAAAIQASEEHAKHSPPMAKMEELYALNEKCSKLQVLEAAIEYFHGTIQVSDEHETVRFTGEKCLESMVGWVFDNLRRRGKLYG